MKVLISSIITFLAWAACGPEEGSASNTDKLAIRQQVPEPHKTSTTTSSTQDTTSGWLTFRGNNQRTGHTTINGPRSAKLKWVFRTQGRIYADAAVTQDGTIYLASHDHFVYAIDSTGRQIWSFDTGGKIWTPPTISKDGLILVGTDNDLVTALTKAGKVEWTFSTAPVAKGVAEGTPKPKNGRFDVDAPFAIGDDGCIYFGCHNNLYALQPNGELKWRFVAGKGKSKVFTSPALSKDNILYFGTQGDFFFALGKDKKVYWHIETKKDIDSTAAIGNDGTIFFGADDGILRAVAPGGNLRFETKLGNSIRAPISIAPNGNIVASVFSTKPFIASFNQLTGKELWRFHVEPGEGAFYGIKSGALIDKEGFIYFGSEDHHVYCISPKGKLVWKYKTGDQVDAGPVMGPDGTLYIGSDDKRLYAFGS